MQGIANSNQPHDVNPRAASDDAATQAATPATLRVVGDPVADPTPATLKLYAGDWARFVQWCREQGCSALPASSATLSAYLLAVAPELSRGALGRRRSAIGQHAPPRRDADPVAEFG